MRSSSIRLKKIYFLLPISLIILMFILLSFEKEVVQVNKEEALDISEFAQ